MINTGVDAGWAQGSPRRATGRSGAELLDHCDTLTRMKAKLLSQIIAAGLLGACNAMYSSHCYHESQKEGRQVFLVSQAQYFDKHYANPDPLLYLIASGAIVALALFGFYEVLTFGIFQFLSTFSKKTRPWDN